jgi:hypothetical protein
LLFGDIKVCLREKVGVIEWGASNRKKRSDGIGTKGLIGRMTKAKRTTEVLFGCCGRSFPDIDPIAAQKKRGFYSKVESERERRMTGIK